VFMGLPAPRTMRFPTSGGRGVASPDNLRSQNCWQSQWQSVHF